MRLRALRVAARLGLANLVRASLYRAGLRVGWWRLRLPVGDASVVAGKIFPPPRGVDENDCTANAEKIAEEADNLLSGKVVLFGRPFQVGSPPDWFQNPLTRDRVPSVEAHWSRGDVFQAGTGDIKGIWEMSRFGWAVVLARAASATGDRRYTETLEAWTADWIEKNPVNQGPNWKCGQETGLRLLHVLLAARILDPDGEATGTLVRFAIDHLRRIVPTLHYAIAQDNNHGISEAAALFVGGAWLGTRDGVPEGVRKDGAEFERLGRRWLVDRVCRLVMSDGSFSEYSTNYHRSVVDTLREVEVWRRELDRPELPDAYRERCALAVDWLDALTDPASGDAPNLGGNDGSHLFRMHGARFRDYRRSVEESRRVFATSGPSDGATSRVFVEGGYVKLIPPGTSGETWGLVRVPRYSFRPADSDALHLDLWHRGRNLLRDAGSYSYAVADRALRNRLAGPAGHNTVQFEDRDPMPLLSAFLRETWLDAHEFTDVEETPEEAHWRGAYRDATGAGHERQVEVRPGRWTIVDRLTGSDERAVLRWRLGGDEWEMVGDRCTSSLATLRVDSDVPPTRIELVEDVESRFYHQLETVQVLEVEIPGSSEPREIKTTIVLEASSG